MHIVLWDTRKLDAAKDFAGGFGVGQYQGHGGIAGQMIRRFYKRDHRPTALNFAYMSAVFKKLGHTVEYSEDRVPRGGDIYVFNPSLITLHLERRAMRRALTENPDCKVWVTGLVAYAVPEAFDGLNVTIVKGEPEQLLWKFDDVLNAHERIVDVGRVDDLDTLPFPDWSPFGAHRFRIAYDFWKFPTGLVQQSRGCTFKCNYCPYIIVENTTRFRDPECVVEEMRVGMRNYGFQSYKFRDPLFGLDRKRVIKMAELIGKLPHKIQFSIESRIDLLRPETLKLLRDVGLVSITVGIETPSEETLKHYKRAPIRDDKQREFTAICRSLGIRTVAGFMIGFPEDTEKSILGVLKYAKQVNPTWANFNVVTPYPGTEFFQIVKDQIANFDFTQYNVYTPVMKYEHLTPKQVQDLHAKCFIKYYFRGRWLDTNAHLVWPWLRAFGVGRKWLAQQEEPSNPAEALQPAVHAHAGPPKPLGGLRILQPQEEHTGTACHTHGHDRDKPNAA
jgi:anaerobic magnesium-protoporphyrin IX monomethyl ester cyclase